MTNPQDQRTLRFAAQEHDLSLWMSWLKFINQAFGKYRRFDETVTWLERTHPCSVVINQSDGTWSVVFDTPHDKTQFEQRYKL